MKRVKKILFAILSILLGLVLIFSIYNFISLKVLHKDLATINGYALLEVVSGSMEPTIYKGDMIIINTKENDYKENDIITFRGKEGEFVTHRIISINDKTMITKGDNNNTEDDPTNMSNIVGKYVTKINGAGKIISSFKNPFTMVMIFVIGLLACILLSTDSDGKPILEKDEQEFQEFLKNKSEPKEVKKTEVKQAKETSKKKEDSQKEIKKTSVKKANDKDTSKVKDNKENSTKKSSAVKTAKSNTTKRTATNKVSTKNKASTAKNSGAKKETVKKVATKKPTSKKNSTSTNKSKK